MINASNKTIVLATILILIVCTAGISLFIIYPKIVTIKMISDDVQNQKQELEEKYQRGQSLRAIYANIATVKQNRDRLNATVIEQDNELEFITALEKTTEGLAVNQNIVLSPPNLKAPTNKLQLLAITVTLDGGFIDILKTVERIEQLPYYLIVEKLDFSSDQTINSPSAPDQTPLPNQRVRAVLKGKIYWMPH
ncbi:hypothetical protein HY933_04210 [Candidatus Falkowbacteria bacterium]|nr:hypothetical protein [Candidatus Falkowbacteria bacterium]